MSNDLSSNRDASNITLSATANPQWIQNIIGGNKITWYHACGNDGRPILILRAMANWSFGSVDENEKIRKIGIELRETTFVCNDTSRANYECLMRMCQINENEPRANRPLKIFRNIDSSLVNIKPFSIFSDVERNAYREKYSVNNNFGHDGFIMRFPWFRSFPELCDTVVYFCLDDRFLLELFQANNIEVTAIFENRADHEGSPSFYDLFQTPSEAQTIKYLFTDHYNYCDAFGKYLLCSHDYSPIWHDFEVMNLVKGRDNGLTYLPTHLPEFAPENNDTLNGYCDVCKKDEENRCRTGCSVVGYGGGFCLAMRRSI